MKIPFLRVLVVEIVETARRFSLGRQTVNSRIVSFRHQHNYFSQSLITILPYLVMPYSFKCLK